MHRAPGLSGAPALGVREPGSQGQSPSGGSGKPGGQPLPGTRTHFLLHHTAGEAAGRAEPAQSTLPSTVLQRKVGATPPGRLLLAGWTRRAPSAANPTLCFWTK